MPASWNSFNGSRALPPTCLATSVKGTYSPPCAIATSVAVTFEELATTSYGENIYILGSVPELGDWDINRAIAMSPNGYTIKNPEWQTTVNMSAGLQIEYKYIRKEQDGGVIWESDPNRVFVVPEGCTGKAVERDVWR